MPTIDITALAAAVVTSLSIYLTKAGESFAAEIGKTASTKIGELYKKIKARCQNHQASAEVLQDFENTPSDPDLQAALRVQLRKLLTADPAFAHDLLQQFQDMGKDSASVSFLTQIFGGKVGNIINIHRVDQVTLE